MGEEYKREGKRTYHSGGKVHYILPADPGESKRLIHQHKQLKAILYGNYTAPIEKQLEKGISVLDSGCGPGTWTIDMANTYKNSDLYGLDISNRFIEEDRPSNVHFAVGNLAETLPFDSHKFDFIYQRLLVFGLVSSQWDNNLKELLRVLKPGGILELVETDLIKMKTFGPICDKFINVLIKVLVPKGMPLTIARELGDRLNNTGYTRITDEIISVPFCHGGELGELSWDSHLKAFQGVRPSLAKEMPEWDDEDTFDQFLDTMYNECRDNKAIFNYRVIKGHKPSVTIN